jgi:chromosome segregation ATPase
LVRIIRKAGRLGLPFEEARRRIEKLEKDRDEVNEQLSIMNEKTTWSSDDDFMQDELEKRLSSINRRIIQDRDAYSLHIQEELKQSTGTLNRLTMVLIGVTVVLAVLTTLLYLKAH